MAYLLTYKIDFTEMLADEDDYIRYMNKIQTFVNTGIEKQIIHSDAEIFPAYDEEKESYEYIVNARFNNAVDLQMGLDMLYSFCILNFLREDEHAVISNEN